MKRTDARASYWMMLAMSRSSGFANERGEGDSGNLLLAALPAAVGLLLLSGCCCCCCCCWAAAAAAAVGQLQVAYSLLLKLLLRLWCGQSRPQVSRWNKKKHRTEFLQ
jgi:hypothetical protein